MSEDQFNQVMAKLAIIDKTVTETNSITREIAMKISIMYAEMDKLAKRMDSLETATLGRRQ